MGCTDSLVTGRKEAIGAGKIEVTGLPDGITADGGNPGERKVGGLRVRCLSYSSQLFEGTESKGAQKPRAQPAPHGELFTPLPPGLRPNR